jgi:thioesterase domain-containing protein
VNADITLVRAVDGRVTEFAGHPAATAPDWGWSELTSGTVSSTAVPGTHHTLLTSGRVGAVADAITR